MVKESAARKIVVFGPGPQFKGGMAHYTGSLAKAFDAEENTEVYLLSWTQQYPAIVPRDFIDRSSKSNQLKGSEVKVEYLTNYNNPFTWAATVNRIKEIGPEMVVIQWSIAIQGLPLGYIVRRLRKETKIEVVIDCHFVIQKEQSAIDKYLSKMGLGNASSFVVHAWKTADELKQLFPDKEFAATETGERNLEGKAVPVIKLFHPVYDMFKPDENFDKEGQKALMGLSDKVFLFFGFIRKYKGLHFCLEAFAKLAKKRDDVSLLVVGESFWQTLDKNKLSTRVKKVVFGFLKGLLTSNKESEDDYNPLGEVERLGIKDRIRVVNTFVPNEEVYKYWQVSDATLLFYEYATPSGVESMASNFAMPILASKVGHFPETIVPGLNGYLAEGGNTDDMVRVMEYFLDNPIPVAGIKEMAARFSWKRYAQAIMNTNK